MYYIPPSMVRAKQTTCIEFGNRLRKLREEQEISQEALALKADLHRTYLGGVERGERNPTLTMICKIASALNVSPSELLKGIKRD